MKAVDTSVLVAAFASWHEFHGIARRALTGSSLVGHAVVETYSVLTRLPPPHRVPPAVAAEYLSSFGTRSLLVASVALLADFPARCADVGVSGGATYDALIAATAQEGSATLVSLDARAATTYRAFGASYDLLAA